MAFVLGAFNGIHEAGDTKPAYTAQVAITENNSFVPQRLLYYVPEANAAADRDEAKSYWRETKGGAAPWHHIDKSTNMYTKRRMEKFADWRPQNFTADLVATLKESGKIFPKPSKFPGYEDASISQLLNPLEEAGPRPPPSSTWLQSVCTFFEGTLSSSSFFECLRLNASVWLCVMTWFVCRVACEFRCGTAGLQRPQGRDRARLCVHPAGRPLCSGQAVW